MVFASIENTLSYSFVFCPLSIKHIILSEKSFKPGDVSRNCRYMASPAMQTPMTRPESIRRGLLPALSTTNRDPKVTK